MIGDQRGGEEAKTKSHQTSGSASARWRVKKDDNQKDLFSKCLHQGEDGL